VDISTVRELEFSNVQGIYLNHAGISPLPARTSAAVQLAAHSLTVDPVQYFMTEGLPRITSARTRLAGLMGVPSEHLAFTRNTGHGLSIVADSLDLKPGDNIVCLGIDYPAVVYPWNAQVWRGIEVRLVPAWADGSFAAEDLAAAADINTKVFAISWVQFATGFRADIKRIVDMAHSLGALCVVDVIQGLGALKYDNSLYGADVVATGSHKWLLAAPGVGGLYVAPAALERMHLVNIGAISVENPYNFDSTVFDPKKTIQRAEEGSPNLFGLVGLDASISLIDEVGIEKIEARVTELATVCIELLEKKGYVVSSSQAEGTMSGIVMFGHPTHANAEVMEALKAAKVSCVERNGKIRFAPHLYNTAEEIARAVEALPV